MTNEELIIAFPECDKVKRDDMRQCIIEAMEQERFYSQAVDKIYRKAKELFPYCGGSYDEDNPEQNAYRAYFQGDWKNGKESPFGGFLKTFEQEFIARHGLVHTKEEACRIAADKWVDMIFGNHLQDNGDDSSSGAVGMMLGTMVKEKAREKYGEDVVSKAHELIEKFYMNDCIIEGGIFKFPHPLSCDYHPDQNLFDILVEAGVSERDADYICPWKTHITINEIDNAVHIHGYQTERLI